MKTLFFILLISFALLSANAQNNVDALTPEDVQAFRVEHQDDTAVLFFHNSNDSKQTGFFESIFGLFGSKGDLDEEYQALIAEKYPVIEIDAKINALKNVPDDYQVNAMPYIIAYHKNKEIWREMPSKQSATLIENLIKERNQGVELKFDNIAKETPARVAQPFVAPVITPYVPTVRPIQSLASSTAGTIEMVDPFDETKHYSVNRTDYLESDFGHLYRGEGYRGEGYRGDGYRGDGYYGGRYASARGPGTAVISEPAFTTAVGPVSTTASTGFYRGDTNRIVERPRSIVQENLSGLGPRVVSTDNAAFSQRNYVRPSGVPADSGARVTTTVNGARDATISTVKKDDKNSWGGSNAYGPPESTGGVVVRTYDADKRF